MFINFFLNSEVPAKFKCKPSLGAYKEESGRLFKCKPSLGAYKEESGRLFNNKLRYKFVYLFSNA